MTDHLIDPKGRRVPVDLIKPVDRARHCLVMQLVRSAQDTQRQLGAFKRLAMTEIAAFVKESAAKYNAPVGGHKGNVQLVSYDGRFKVQRSIADQLVFDERLQVAKTLIDECIREWSSGSRTEIRALVEHAFQVDKQGKVSTERVLGLRRLDIDDVRWLRAMAAISDSVQVASSKAYLRFYERVGDKWQPISLDLANAPEPEEVSQ